MAKIYPLFSSSKGNATYIGTKKQGILIDAGVSYKRLTAAFDVCSLDISAVSAVFITHDHSDHICGLNMLTKHNDITVYAQEMTLRRLIDSRSIAPGTQIRVVSDSVDICGMKVTAFDTPHDTTQSCGYRIVTENGGVCAVCTDLGHVTDIVEKSLLGASTVLLEANYDLDLMNAGSYPAHLKARIRSKNGHLSNEDSAQFAKRLIKNGTTQIILGHLSQENNTPEQAQRTFEAVLSEHYTRGRDYILNVAPVSTIGQAFVINTD